MNATIRPAVGRTLRRLLAMTSLVCLWACVPTAENPILVPGQPTTDSRLLGTWFGTFENDDAAPVYLHFMAADENRKDNPAGGMDVLMVMDPANTDNDAGWGWLYALSAEVAGKHYLSVEFRLDSGNAVADDVRGYHLFSYDIGPDGALDVRAIDDDKITQLIKDKVVVGTVEDSTFLPDIRITESSEGLVKFLATDAAKDLFTQQRGPFRRVTQ